MGTDATSAPASTSLTVPPGTSMDPKLALALNVHANPGVYALLLGSGISMASGVKTGWGIVEDLVARIATVHDPNNPEAGSQASADPESWWTKNFTSPLGYSSLLEEVAQTPAARQALLDPYFVPEDGEEATDKAPTAAHRAIARMVKRGSFRVILTTNFDRLMERALEDVGFSPQVVSRPEQIDAIKPLPHSQITVVKLHGDYADLQQRNTVTELDSYPEAQQELLKRVLDEYGLIVCGWSADWDKALVRAVEGTRSRRYPLFWSTYGPLGTEATRLTAQHSAAVLKGMSADELFTDLERRLEALDRLSAPPISRDMAVVQLKKALPDPVKRIELTDLVMETAFSVVTASTRERYPLSGPAFAESARRYRSDSDVLLHLLATGVFHDDSTHDELWLRALERLARIRNSYTGSFNGALEALRHYPSLLATWTVGVAAVLARREELLATVMTRPTWTNLWDRTEQQPPAVYLNPYRVIPGDLAELVPPPPQQHYLYPQSRLLRQEVREPLRRIEPDDAAYEGACNRFEFLASMIAIDSSSGEWPGDPWPGEFLLDASWNYEQGLASTIRPEITPAWPLLQAGAFDGDLERATKAYDNLVQWRQQQRPRSF